LTQQARDWLAQARRVCVLTGAGISAESGIPTFRGAGGLWREYRAADLATPGAFERDPKLVWEWYDWRRGVVKAARPNAGHDALAEYERRRPDGFTLVTQNVDGLHERAGSRAVERLHGSLWRVRCTGCGRDVEDERAPLPELPPRCGECGALLRPGVVWFGEMLPEAALEAAVAAASSCEVMLVVGTSAVVYPAASLAPLARRAGARLIEVNVEETPASGLAEVHLRGSAGAILPEILS
jgi:NAD-dependent deacetylase